MRRLLVIIGVLGLACSTAWAQCGSLVMNPVTGKMDCVGTPGAGGGDMAAATYITSGAGAPSNPCATIGIGYINTTPTPRTFYKCPSTGGNWVGPFALKSDIGTAGAATLGTGAGQVPVTGDYLPANGKPATAGNADTVTNGLYTTTPASTLGAAFHCIDAGANDSYACDLAPAITAYTTGQVYWFKAATANTGAATLTLNSIAGGAIPIKKLSAGVTTVLADNDIRAGQWVAVVYDGTNMQMQSQIGNVPAGGGSIASTPVMLKGDNGGNAVAGTAADIPFTQTGTGAVARTVDAKLKDTVSVFDFIPVADQAAIVAGTSTTDEATAVIAAIATLTTGQVLTFSSGTYVLSSLGVLTPGITIDFGGAVIKVKTAGILITTTDAADHDPPFLFKGGMFKPNAGYTPTDIFKIQNSNNTRFENTTFSGLTTSHAILWNDTGYGITCDGCKFEDNVTPNLMYLGQTAADTRYSYNARIVNSDMSNTTGTCITAEGGQLLLKDSVVEACSVAGIVHGGVSAYRLWNLTIDGVHFESNGGHNILGDTVSGNHENVTVRNSRFGVNPSDEIMYLGSVTQLIFDGNFVDQGCIGGDATAISGAGNTHVQIGVNIIQSAGSGCTAGKYFKDTLTASSATLSTFFSKPIWWTGEYPVWMSFTGATNITIPTSGTLATTAGSMASMTGLTAAQIPGPQAIDCSAACSPSAAQLTHSEVSNYGQTTANVAITGPTLAAGMNFIMTVGTAQAGDYWHYTSTTGNVYLDAAGPYTTVGFAAPAVGNAMSCFSFRTGASTYSLRCTTLNGTSTGS